MSDRDSEDVIKFWILKEHQVLHDFFPQSLNERRTNYGLLRNSANGFCRRFLNLRMRARMERDSCFYGTRLCWNFFFAQNVELWLLTVVSVTINKCNLIIEDSNVDSDKPNNNNSVDRCSDLNIYNTMDVNDNSVDGGIDLNSNNKTMDVNKNCVGRGIDPHNNDLISVSTSGANLDFYCTGCINDKKLKIHAERDSNFSNSVDRGNHLNRNDVMSVNKNSVDRSFDLNKKYMTDVNEDVNDNEDK
ncbi:hypothetical protein YC2023_002205 [Brassica napus]